MLHLVENNPISYHNCEICSQKKCFGNVDVGCLDTSLRVHLCELLWLHL